MKKGIRLLSIGLLSFFIVCACTIQVHAVLGIGVKVKVVDSITSSPIQGAEYEVCKSNAFDTTIYTMTTDAQGEASIDDLSLGVWYMRQTVAPKGYIKYKEILPVSIGVSILTLNLKLTPYGKIEIQKKDNENNPVVGAKFSLYEGSLVSGTPLLTGLTTGEGGKLLLQDITPGMYALLETEAPEGYHLNVIPSIFEVLAGNTKVVSIVNTKIVRGSIRLYKKDAITQLPLAGAKFAVYKDIAQTQLVKEVTSVEEGAAIVDNLLPGTYYIKETQVPQGYLMDSIDQSVLLVEGETKDVTFYNHRSYPTAGNFASTLLVGIGMLSLCLIVYCIYRKKPNKKE